VLGFCQQRGLPTKDIKIIQRTQSNPMTGLVSKISLDIQLPPDFPEKYKAAVIESAEQCNGHFERESKCLNERMAAIRDALQADVPA
jgi:hypothetical protein